MDNDNTIGHNIIVQPNNKFNKKMINFHLVLDIIVGNNTNICTAE